MMGNQDSIFRPAAFSEANREDASSPWSGRAASWRIARWAPWLVLCLGLAITALLWHSERDSNARQLQAKFDSLVLQTDALITERLQVYEEVLLGTQGLFAASTNVSRKEFHDYVASLRLAEHYSGIQGVGFSLLVPASKKAPHIDAVRSEGFPGFVIHPEGERKFYTSVIYLEPFNQRNQQAFGYDMYSDKFVPRIGDSSQGLRHDAMEQARDTAKAAISGKVHLMMETDTQVQAGFLMYLPVYKAGLSGDTIDERRANLVGWVYAPFRMNDLMTEILGKQAKDIEIKIYDGKQPRDHFLMYSLGKWSKDNSPEEHLTVSRNILIAGHPWHVAMRSLPGFGSELAADKARIIVTAGSLLSVLLALLVWLLASSRARAVISAVELGHELSERKKVQQALHDAEAFSRATINAISEQICVIDRDGTVLAVNAAWNSNNACRSAINCRVGDNYFDASEFALGSDQESLGGILAGIRAVMQGEKAHFSVVYTSGSPDAMLYFLLNVTRFSDDVNKLVIVQEDISERKKDEESLKLAASVFNNVTEAITVTDANCNIIAVNPAFTQITGYSPAEVIGKNPRILQSGRHDGAFYQEMWRCLNTYGRWQGEIWNQAKNGNLVAEWISICAINDATGMVERYVAVFSNITEKKKMEKLVWDQANFDALTSLPNRHLFLDRLSMEISKSVTHQLSFGLFFIDLDNFKEVNETLGHHIGDKLLIHASQRISSCLRATDTAGRLGGDEFTVLLPGINDQVNIESIVQEILDRLAEPYLIGDERVYLTASVGITLYPQDATEPGDLFKNADQALYVAKNAGRNRYSYFTKTMEESARMRLQTLNDLRVAIDADQLKVFFQPIINLSNNQVIKAEALLRWFHPQRGMISPAEFIPIAEESGLINDIGDWVFKESALWAQRWSKQIGRPFQISVNKSPVQFHAKTKYTSWTEYLQMLGLPGSCINVEITEGLLLNPASGVSEKLLDYSNAGIEVSIDDFGTGYSSMSYLKKFHIDYLKIDQSFVRDMEIDEADRAIAEAIIVMAHKLGCKVIAEGIETEGQRALLMAAGCDFGQGYLFSKAISPSEFESLFIHTAYSETVL